ncbi:MAG TPA: sulfatase, partial [Kofleriaceae bacterium]|nr:sulfatase [Kofleriaceae bacterium]
MVERLERVRSKTDSVTDLVDRPMHHVLWEDVKRIWAALLVGCSLAALFEYAATLLLAPEGPVPATALRLLLLDLVLFAVLYLVLAPLLSLAAVALRLALWADSQERARRHGGLVPPVRAYEGPRRSAAWLWAAVVAGALFVALSARLARLFATAFKEQTLASLAFGAAEVVVALACATVAFVVAMLIHRAAQRLHRRLGRMNPLGHPTTAALALLLVFLVVGSLLLRLLPQLTPLVPFRHLWALAILALGTHGATYLFARRGGLLPRPLRRRLAVAGALVFAATVLIPVTLARVGADPATKSLAVSASPLLRSLIDGLRTATDFDRDGYGTLLGENDCAPWDPEIHPLARDIPDNRRDENCDGRDFQLGRIPSYRTGQKMPVPDGYRQPWNVLFITVDTVRYDHTNMGGYRERTGRDTTPNLARLAARSVSFSFANAPSAGTMASVPAILTSKFFHSGLALDENVKRGMPPRLKDQNLLLGELFKGAGYATGAILTHEYFNDFGMQQGLDTYDNELGRAPDPMRVTSDKLTDRALAWIGRHNADRWFLWLHYIDPHGRYVAHPGDTSYGSSEEDLYDGELAFTDKHIGRLLDELARLPGADRTVIALTSDHGDGFNEHGFINHGTALYRELLHVPLIVYVPNIEPRTVPGAVSPLDLVPTLVDLCGLTPPRGAEFEGESLVPQLFYQQDAHRRVVFAETNAPRPLRAAITSKYKLIYDLKANVHELYDLEADPWEKKNVWLSDKAGFETMKRYLDDWLERVYYARDPAANQAMNKLGEYLLDRPPSPAHRTSGVGFDDGAIEVLGFDLPGEAARAGDKVEVSVYFRAARRPSGDFQLQLVAYPPAAAAAEPPARSPARMAGGGLLPTSRWRDGEHLRERLKLRIPDDWPAGSGQLGLRLTRAGGKGPP